MEKKAGDDSFRHVICRCEEITRAEIREAIRCGYSSLSSIKRKTRAGMGFCQGRICGPLIQNIIFEMTGHTQNDSPPDTTRFPVFPVRLGILAKAPIDENKSQIN
ncbi:MAG: (2Fe-2S)-binding protein [Spirochaetota bacterium]